MDHVKGIASAAGGLTGAAVNKAGDLSETHDVKNKAKEMYSNMTGGRNAAQDAQVLKYSGVATAAAVTVSAAPTIALAGAVAMGVATTAKNSETAAKAKSTYEEKLGRNLDEDKETAKHALKQGFQGAKQLASSFHQGYKEERAKKSS